MKRTFIAAIGLALAVVISNQALHWLNEKSDLFVWAGYLTLAALASLAVGGSRILWRRWRLSEAARRIAMLSLLLAAMVASPACRYKTVPPGHVGIRVEFAGSERGVQEIPLQTGRIWFNPFTEAVLDYPIFVQRAIWTRSAQEGSPVNEEISFQSRDALHFSADVSVSYQLLRDKVPHFYVQFRNDNVEHFTHGFLRDAVRNAIGRVAVGYTAEEINGARQAEITEKAMALLTEKLAPIGVEVIQLGFTAPPRPPEEVANAIRMKVAAIQHAEQAENEKRQAVAEGEKTVALAQATARANDAINRSITPQLVQWRQLEILSAKWDGKFPQVQGGNATPMLMIPPPAR